MIAVDSSAVVAIALGEAEAPAFIECLRADGNACMTSANYVEAGIVLEGRYGAAGRATFEEMMRALRKLGLNIVDVDFRIAESARAAFGAFGKGRHAVGLNFGDCFAYALAKELDAPLLYKGRDFDRTDVKCAQA